MVWGAVAAVAGSVISSNSQKKSARAASREAAEAAAGARTTYDPYRKAGLGALSQYLELLGLDSRVARETNPDNNVQALLDMGYSDEQATMLAKGKPQRRNTTREFIAQAGREGFTPSETQIAEMKNQEERDYQMELSNWSISRERPSGGPVGSSRFGTGSNRSPGLPGSQGAPQSQADMVRSLIQSDPGYQATIDLATEQTSRTAAAQGRSSGGGFLGDLYTQNAAIAGDFYQKRLANLSGLINVGSGAGAASANLTTRMGEIQGAGTLAVGQANANMWGNLGTVAGQYFGSQSGGNAAPTGSSASGTSSGMSVSSGSSNSSAASVFGG